MACDAEPGGQHPVERGRGAAALDVPEHGRAGLLAGALLDLARPASGRCRRAGRARTRRVPGRPSAVVAVLRVRALGDHHDRRVPGLEPLLDVLADLLDVERLLGDQDHVRAAGHARVQRDPAGVAAHHLDDQRAVVALRRGVQPVDRLHRDVHRGVEAERVVGGAEVVVDGLRHADDLHARLVQPRRDAEGVLAADRDQRVDAEAGQVVGDPLQPGPPSRRRSRSGLVRDEPRIVPPRGRMPRTACDVQRHGVAPRAGRASRRGTR